jgi:membrane-associated phospholipid phosphatase
MMTKDAKDMMRNVWFIVLVIPLQAYAQQDSVKRADIWRGGDGVFRTYTAPVQWKGKNWLTLGALAAGTTALSAADRPVRQFWTRYDNTFLDEVSGIGNHYGKPYSAFLFTGGFYMAGLVLKNQWAKETGLILGTSLLTVGLLESFLKPAVGRARPEEDLGNYHFSFLDKRGTFHSFPSGHASIAFTISFVMARRVNSVPLKIGFYSLAASTAVCRLYSDAHWISDVAFGSALAWFCSDFIIKRMEVNRYRPVRPGKVKWSVSPVASGLSFKGTFQ